MSGNHAGKPLTEKQELKLAKKDGQAAPKHARVTTEPPAGSDPNPFPLLPVFSYLERRLRRAPAHPSGLC